MGVVVASVLPLQGNLYKAKIEEALKIGEGGPEKQAFNLITVFITAQWTDAILFVNGTLHNYYGVVIDLGRAGDFQCRFHSEFL
jgi:hypothetical protein